MAFQLAAVNGYLFKEDPTAEYVVVSEDGGYDGMIEFMRGMGENPFLNVGDRATDSFHFFFLLLFGRPELQP